jgi:hypothetical protein
MRRPKGAIIAIALAILVAQAAPAVAARITHDSTDIILLAETAVRQERTAEPDRMELVANASEVGEMTTANPAAVAAPAPAALAMFGIGLLALAAVRRLRRR